MTKIWQRQKASSVVIALNRTAEKLRDFPSLIHADTREAKIVVRVLASQTKFYRVKQGRETHEIISTNGVFFWNDLSSVYRERLPAYSKTAVRIMTIVFSLKYWTAKNNSKWVCPENFRELLIIELKCLVWTKPVSRVFLWVNMSNYCRLLCTSVRTHKDTYWTSSFEVAKRSDRSDGHCRLPQS